MQAAPRELCKEEPYAKRRNVSCAAAAGAAAPASDVYAINDPNGLVWYKDAYHFFYQYNPFGLTWGEPCWGHAVSRDLLHWTQLPPALVPSEPYDMYEQGGCFSGCALVVGQRLYLLYTGVCEKDGHCVQAQCLAWSDDGVTFQKYENNFSYAKSLRTYLCIFVV